MPTRTDRSPMRTAVRPVAALALPVAAILGLSACSDAEAGADTAAGGGASEVSVTHAQGETAVPADPETVVVFDVGVISTLDSLGVDVAGVPDATYPESLAQYGGGGDAKGGSLFEPGYEAGNAP